MSVGPSDRSELSLYNSDELINWACDAQVDGYVTSVQTFPESAEDLEILSDQANRYLDWYGCQPGATPERIQGIVFGRKILQAMQQPN